MSKKEFVEKVLSEFLSECYDEVLGAAYEKNGADEVVTLNFADATLIRVDVLNMSKRKLANEVINAVEYWV